MRHRLLPPARVTDSPPPTVHVGPPDPLRRAAMALLLDDAATADDACRLADAGEIDLSRLCVLPAEPGGPSPVRAVGLLVVQRDGKAVLWPPRTLDDAATAGTVTDNAAFDAVLHAAAGEARAAGSGRLTSFLGPSDTRAIAALTARGFGEAAVFLDLRRTLDEPLPGEPGIPPDSLGYSAETHARFVAVVADSHRGSLDCPALRGDQTAEQDVASWRATGRFSPHLWRLVRVDGRDAAVSVAAAHDDGAAAELLYLGVSPEFRGRGLGAALTTDLLHAASAGGLTEVRLAVDRANGPAVAVYERLGFRRIGEKVLLVADPAAVLAQSAAGVRTGTVAPGRPD